MTGIATQMAGTGLATQLSGLYAIWLREVKRAIRDRGQFVGGVSRPILWVLIMGIGSIPISAARSTARCGSSFPTRTCSTSSPR